MAQITVDSQLVPHDELLRVGSALLQAHGLTESNAQLVIESLVASDLRGINSHGIARLSHYLKRLKIGSIKATPELVFEAVSPACGIVDGGHGLGQLVMTEASDRAVELARQSGAGWVAVRNSSHCGALAHYGLRIARQGMVGLVFTHVGPVVLPYGSREPFCGTNPICIAVNGLGDDHLCLDMATSGVPWNTVANAAIEGVSIPTGWAVDANGEDVTDASQAVALHAFGGHKGSGLGLMIDVLCSLMTGSPYGPDIPKMYGDLTKNRRLGGMVGAIDIAKFINPDMARAQVSAMMKRWNNLTPAAGHERVYYPGQPEAEESKKRLEHGIPIGNELFKELNGLAQAHDIEPLA